MIFSEWLAVTWKLSNPYFQITTFFSDKLDSLGPGRAAYETALQSIKGNIAWLEKHKGAVEESVKDITV